jgi:hypothetical protein
MVPREAGRPASDAADYAGLTSIPFGVATAGNGFDDAQPSCGAAGRRREGQQQRLTGTVMSWHPTSPKAAEMGTPAGTMLRRGEAMQVLRLAG